MTPIFVTDLAFALPGPMAFEGNIPQHEPADLGYAAIAVGSSQHVQGPVVQRHRNGQVSIDAGGRVITGYPVNHRLTADAQSRGWWARFTGRAS